MPSNRLARTAGLAAAFVSALALGAAPASAGSLKGTISSSKKAKPAKLKITANKNICGKKPLYDPSLRVAKTGGLANAVVSIEKVKKGKKAKTTTIKVDQHGCEYIPHVQATTVGSTVKVINSDGTLHNVHTFLEGDTLFNLAMPIKGQKTDKDLDEGGVVEFKCDVHPWMKAYILVFDHPYFAVTGKTGSFEIADVPAGTYQVTIWHEKLGTKTEKVTITDGDAATLNVKY